MTAPIPGNGPEAKATQGELFDLGILQDEPEIVDPSEIAHLIGMAAARRPYAEPEPDATDKWLEERGGGTDRGYSPAVDPPKVEGLKKPSRRPGPPTRLLDGDSGLDPYWNVHPGKMTPEEVAAHLEGVGIVRAAIAGANAAASKPNTLIKPWQAPAKVVEDLRELYERSPAKFFPASHSEKRAAIEYLPLLNPDREGLSGIAAHLNNLASRIRNSKGAEAAENFKKSKLEVAAAYLEDAKISQKVFASLSVLLEIKEERQSLYSLLETLPPDVKDDATRVVVRYLCIHEVVDTGRAGIGVDPLRSRKDADTGSPISSWAENPRAKQQIDVMLKGLTVAEVKTALPFMHRDQSRRAQFWNRILQAAGEDGRLIALSILNKHAA